MKSYISLNLKNYILQKWKRKERERAEREIKAF